jgi:hypothetical protein
LLFLLDYKSERNEKQMAPPKAREANGTAKSKGCGLGLAYANQQMAPQKARVAD